MFSLTGKKALITGATGGIGEAIAKTLHAQGAEVVITGRRQEKLDALASELGSNVHPHACDLSNETQLNELFAKAEELAGQIDILVVNAGITKDNLALRIKDEEWEDVIQTNLTATFKLNRAAIKAMMRRKWGRIINMASVVGVKGNAGQSNYVASKAGMIGMSKSIASEVASRSITINCIAPGFIQTPMTDGLNDKQREAITTTIPANRFGMPSDIAATTAFLASEEAGYITGQTLHVNGGMLMV